MPAHQFITVADELLETAEAAVAYFESLGYSVHVEEKVLGHPFLATLWAKRNSTTNLVEVAGSVDLNRLGEWAAYGMSCSTDTRITVALPAGSLVSATQTQKLKKLGVGVLMLDEDDQLDELISPQDLAVNVKLPNIARDHQRVRSILGPVYETFRRNLWREGFEEGCKALEAAAKEYLWKGVSAGRILVLTDKGNPRTLSRAQIDRMTLGGLAKAFANFQSPNHSDAVVSDTLAIVVKDRNLATHHKRKAASEKALRANVGSHVWRIVAALREIYK